MNGTRLDIWRLQRRWQTLDIAALQQTRRGIRFVELADTHVRIRVGGKGSRTLVFACDPPNVVEQYDEIIERLGERFRIVVLEQPGMGFSFPKATFSFTQEAYAASLIELLETLQFQPYVLALPCASVFAGMRAAKLRTDLISHLVLMQATSWAQQLHWVRELAKTMGLLSMGMPVRGDKLIGTPYLGQAVSALTERWFPHTTTGPSVYRAKKRADFQQRFMQPHKTAFAMGACNCQVSMYQRYFVGDETPFESVPQPTLVLFGNRDISHDNSVFLNRPGLPGWIARQFFKPVYSDQQGLLRYAQQGVFQEIPESGHFVELENPKIVCGAISSFLA